MAGRSRRRPLTARLLAPLVLTVALLALGCAPTAAPSGGAVREPLPPAGAASSGSTSAAPASPAPPGTPPSLVPVRIAYSSLWGANAVPWTAHEAGIFAKHGLDTQLTYISSAQTVPAALANEVDISFGGGYAVISSRLGGGDLLIFFNPCNWSPYELMVTPDVQTGADLRGKTLGVSRFGSASDVATRQALTKLGLAPERDVVLIQMGALTERIAAMKAGALAGGVAVPPDNLILRRQGFHTLVDLGATGDPELTNTAFATSRWLDANPSAAQAFTDALVEGIHFAKNNRAFTEKVLGQYLQLEDPEEIAEAYEHFVGPRLQRLPDIGVEAARGFLESQVPADPRAASARPTDFFDTRFLDRTRTSGLVERLYGTQ